MSSQRRRGRWLWLLAALLGACVPASAGVIYKWVDERGVTQYGEMPPPGATATPIGLPAPPDRAAQAQAAERAREAIARAARGASAPAGVTGLGATGDGRAGLEARLQSCAAARQQLDTVTHVGPVYRLDAGGQRDHLPDDQRAAEIARWREQVAVRCAGLDSDAATRERWRQMNDHVECVKARERLAGRDPRRTPHRLLEQLLADVATLCAPGRFPAATGSLGEWFNPATQGPWGHPQVLLPRP